MKLVSLIPLLSTLFLTGCGPLFFNYMDSSSAWHAQDMEGFLQKNYPNGSDQRALIEYFQLHNYSYEEMKCSAPLCARTLSVPASCSLFWGAEAGVTIEWVPDSEGKITMLYTYSTMCSLGP